MACPNAAVYSASFGAARARAPVRHSSTCTALRAGHVPASCLTPFQLGSKPNTCCRWARALVAARPCVVHGTVVPHRRSMLPACGFRLHPQRHLHLLSDQWRTEWTLAHTDNW
jgi:hypothetical protein